MITAIAQELVSIPLEDGGSLAGELFYPDTGRPRAATLLCNPHPYMGGTMQNPIIAAVAEALAESGVLAMRFDYSGVGASSGAPVNVAESMAAFWATGHAPLDALCVENARAAARYLERLSEHRVSLVGYSFGALVASEIASADTPAIVFIAPTLRQHAIGRDGGASFLTIYSDNDFATPVATTREWLEAMPPHSRSLCLAGGDHFFKGQEAAVAAACRDHINSAHESR